jgi:LPS sulfotransferase NodH
VTYERLIADPANEVAWLAQELGLDNLEIDRERLQLEPQAGPVNAAWRERYLKDAPTIA